MDSYRKEAMKILVINSGSSSIKFQLINMDGNKVLAKGLLERIAIKGSILNYYQGEKKHVIEGDIPNHEDGINLIVKYLTDPVHGVIRDKKMLSEIASLATYGKFIRDCPLCFAVFGEKKQQFYLEDCCAATENLILALQAHGVSSCWVAGNQTPYVEAVRKLLDVPAEYTLVSLVAAGSPADITITQKKEMKHVAFFEKFEKE